MRRGPDANSAAAIAAARWLKTQRPPTETAVNTVKNKFGLSKAEACEAVVLARGLKIWRGPR
ncbi:hypothetical protein ELH26_00865 [Rhizobium leguminosarum]|jgi:hypothetical protein|nr:hypothetical protein ELH26_00865 [Rhizobium leguminosarum]